MTILVTGGAGFIGSNLVDELINRGEDVIVIDNLSTGKLDNVNPYVKDFIITDISRSLPSVKADIIFHIAALARIQPSFTDPLRTYQSNALGTINVLELARKNKATVVYAGSSSAYHDVHANPYSYTKWVGEEHCKLYHKVYDVPVGIARFFNVYGPRHITDGAYATVIGIFERQKKAGRSLTVTGNGEQRRDFTNVFDIVNGLIQLSKKDYKAEIFNFGTGINYSINEVADMFGGPIEYIPKRPGEAWTTLADISRSQEIGYEAKHKLEDYIHATSIQ